MSTYVDEKLERRVETQGERARRSLKSLQEARGYRVEAGDPKRPAVCSIGRMLGRAYWQHVGRQGDTEMYEFTEEQHPTRST